MKVKPFDAGEVLWYAFRAHFLALADQAEWSERTKTTRLMGCLQGNLTGVMTGLKQPITFDSLMACLDEIYGVAFTREDAVLKLQSFRMEPNEKITLYAERARQLVAHAYPNFTEADRMEQALRCFLQGLPAAGNFRMQIRLKGFRTMTEAVEYGVPLEQIMNDERPRGTPARGAEVGAPAEEPSVAKLAEELSKCKQLVAALQEMRMKGHGRGAGRPIRCYECDQLGHIARNCPNKGNQSAANSRPTP